MPPWRVAAAMCGLCFSRPTDRGQFVIGQQRTRVYSADAVRRLAACLPAPPARILWMPQRFTTPRDLIARGSRVTPIGGSCGADPHLRCPPATGRRDPVAAFVREAMWCCQLQRSVEPQRGRGHRALHVEQISAGVGCFARFPRKNDTSQAATFVPRYVVITQCVSPGSVDRRNHDFPGGRSVAARGRAARPKLSSNPPHQLHVVVGSGQQPTADVVGSGELPPSQRASPASCSTLTPARAASADRDAGGAQRGRFGRAGVPAGSKGGTRPPRPAVVAGPFASIPWFTFISTFLLMR